MSTWILHIRISVDPPRGYALGRWSKRRMAMVVVIIPEMLEVLSKRTKLKFSKEDLDLALECGGLSLGASTSEMKFGKRLASQMEETLPEWKDKFLSYKQLKKRLKVISAPDCFTEAAFEAGSSPFRDGTSVVDVAVDELKRTSGVDTVAESNSEEDKAENKNDEQLVDKAKSEKAGSKSKNDSSAPEEEDSEFTSLLEVELEKFNSFFIEKEEEYVIRLQELKERIERLSQGTSLDVEHHEELIQIRRDIVTFHGEMVLLLNYSSLNYTGLVKILKKYDKRTGTSLRLPFIQRVLHQPFFTTELLCKLVQECEKNLQSIFPSDAELPLKRLLKSGQAEEDSTPQCEEVESIYRSTMAALQTIKDLRKGSSTYSALSLPPLTKDD